MLMPILRLVLIYVALSLAVVAVFNRDKLARLVSGDMPAEVAAAPAAVAAAPAAVAAAPAQPQAPVTPGPAAPMAAPARTSPQPVPGALQTPQPLSAPQATTPGTASPAVPAAQPATGGAAPDLAEALNAARNLYWSGDIAEAGAQLTALAAAHPDNADLHGELGNFRFANRDYAGAAEAYLRAGELLIAEGRSGQAASLVPVLGQIAPDKAQALATLLQNR